MIHLRLRRSSAQHLYDHTGTMPFAPGSWSDAVRQALSEALANPSAEDGPDTPVLSPDDRDWLTEVRDFVARCGMAEYVPGVRNAPVEEWGTIAWARLALHLLGDLQGRSGCYCIGWDEDHPAAGLERCSHPDCKGRA